MIKFFRHIRKRLLAEHRFTRYTLYAMGEIILVVIGILIALQVNEWNKERNRKNAEVAILQQLRTDLYSSQAGLEEEMGFHLRGARNAAHVTQGFWKNEITEDFEEKVNGSLGTRVYNPVMGTARSLISSGKIDLLSSATLRQDIITYIEEVDYKLKDISRYRDTYFHDATELIYQANSTTTQSVEEINESLQEPGWADRSRYRKNMNRLPDQIDRVPFQADIEELHNNEDLYRAHGKLLTCHRNTYYLYNELLRMTNEMLDKLDGRTDRTNDATDPLYDHHILFDSLDLKILQRTDALLADSSKWKVQESEDCDADAESGVYSLYCAHGTASEQVTGTASEQVTVSWQNGPLRPASRIMLHTLEKYAQRRIVANPFRDWNNHPETTFEEVKMVLSECIEIVEAQLKNRAS
jgi:hypothetical protein